MILYKCIANEEERVCQWSGIKIKITDRRELLCVYFCMLKICCFFGGGQVQYSLAYGDITTHCHSNLRHKLCFIRVRDECISYLTF